MTKTRLPEIIGRHEKELLGDWVASQRQTRSSLRERISEAQLLTSSQGFLRTLLDAMERDAGSDISRAEWSGMRSFLSDLSKERANQGFSPSETANFVFSFKPPLFRYIAADKGSDQQSTADDVMAASEILDRLGVYIFEALQKSREDMILRQQQEMLELSTPVVELWEGILALPLIGTLDSARTQIVMQNLLEAIVAKSADLAIIDITGVPTVDTLVAQHLLKTVAAARLMGADCVVSGIRPQIAQTIIHLGVDLSAVMTKATLADAFRLALKRKNLAVGRI